MEECEDREILIAWKKWFKKWVEEDDKIWVPSLDDTVPKCEPNGAMVWHAAFWAGYKAALEVK